MDKIRPHVPAKQMCTVSPSREEDLFNVKSLGYQVNCSQKTTPSYRGGVQSAESESAAAFALWTASRASFLEIDSNLLMP